MALRFAPNISLLWAGLPLPDRFERAARAGFDAVELWWPGGENAELLPGLADRWGLRLALLNFDAGDMAAGDRGLAADPDRSEQLRANVPVALRIARAAGCRRLNLLVGLRQDRYPPGRPLGWARDTVAWAADQAAAAGCEVMIEAVNSIENGPCLLTTTAAAADFVARVGRDNVRLQYDAYHMQQMEGNITATLDAYWHLISHIQIADVPGRGEPGTGEINYQFVLDHLDRKGYDGYVGLEYRPSAGDPEGSFGWLDTFGWSPGARP
jgi:hydroxypyruvate isomerase